MIVKKPCHRPQRSFPDAQRIIVECELDKCIHCGKNLVNHRAWNMRKTVQTMSGGVFVVSK
ncbi:hypothetical protein HGR01_29025 [Tolypothrix sp. PCC 7712]|nr:hypothetical protein HGR01_29025 [Tolypothrix sp. PCC 7712]